MSDFDGLGGKNKAPAHHFPGTGPGADVAVLTGCDEALLPEDQGGQPLVSDFLHHQRLNQGHLVHPGALRAAELDAVVAAE